MIICMAEILLAAARKCLPVMAVIACVLACLERHYVPNSIGNPEMVEFAKKVAEKMERVLAAL